MTAPREQRLAMARNRYLDLRAQWTLHTKLCRDCQNLTRTANKYCAEGWDISKAMNSARQVIDHLTAPPADQQLTLM